MDLFMELAQKLSNEFINYEIKIETNNEVQYFVFINPFWDENILIADDDRCTFLFSFQHAHFDDNEDTNDNSDDLIDYIHKFLAGDLLAIEFFENGRRSFGGSIKRVDLDLSSGKAIFKSFTGDNILWYEQICQLKSGVSYRCSIRGWDCQYNIDIDFIL